MDVPDDLRRALEGVLSGVPVKQAATAVERLIERYREERPADRAILASRTEVAAYAAYRMPATYAAVRSCLEQVSGFSPRRMVDVGGGTGAAAWAATDVFPSLGQVEVIDQVTEALALGQGLAGQSSRPALRAASWRAARLDQVDAYPRADLVTVSYVLSELSPAEQLDVVSKAATAGDVVAVIEPGTPRGYQRVLAARAALLDRSMSVVAPCPHENGCPLPDRDWCHFSARVNRSALHRQIKGADLSYEDEKFSYVIAARTPLPRAPGRVLRHPVRRKGMVTLQVCSADGGAGSAVVTKRDAEAYRSAKKAEWGDPWPPSAGGTPS